MARARAWRRRRRRCAARRSASSWRSGLPTRTSTPTLPRSRDSTALRRTRPRLFVCGRGRRAAPPAAAARTSAAAPPRIEKIQFYPNNKKPKYIILDKKIKKNEFIRKAGSDYKIGDKIISKGQYINSSHILALKTLGIEKIKVKKKLNIVFYPTGDELSDKKKIPFWKVKNSNSSYLNSYIKNLPINFTIKKIVRDKQTIFFKKEIKKKIRL